MKKFHELTKSQQEKAVSLAKIDMKECVQLGLITFKQKPTEAVMATYAAQAAEGSLYTESGERVM